MQVYTDPSPTFDTHEADVTYALIDGPLAGAVLCAAVDLACERVQVRIRRGEAEHVYVGNTLGNELEHLPDPRHLGYAWRPVRWILADGRTHVFATDHPELPVGVGR